MEKSYVSMGVHYCPYCQKNHASGEIILDRRMKRSLQRETSTGISLCPNCLKMVKDQDGVLLVGAKKKGINTVLNGSILGLTREAFQQILPDKEIPEDRMFFADYEVIDKLIKQFG